MRILVFAHELEVGGTQVNAIDLAAALRDQRGHTVALTATPGPMVEYAATKGLEFLPLPAPGSHPSPSRMRALRTQVKALRAEVVHAWDWLQGLDAYFGVHLPMGIPLVITDMMMTLTRILPKRIPTTFGTPELVEAASGRGWREAHLLLPAVDLEANAAGRADGQGLRVGLGVAPNQQLVVTVSRLDRWMKAESLRRTIAAARLLGQEIRLRLLIVGDGAERKRLEALAHEANRELGREVVTFVGMMGDPRAAYEAADLVVGMGGSALRGMAFGKPVIVVGEKGFSEVFSAETAQGFYHRGMYGVGDSNPSCTRLAQQIARLLGSPEDMKQLGELAREFVGRHFGLTVVAERLDGILRHAAGRKRVWEEGLLDSLRTAAIWARERRWRAVRPELVRVRGE